MSDPGSVMVELVAGVGGVELRDLGVRLAPLERLLVEGDRASASVDLRAARGAGLVGVRQVRPPAAAPDPTPPARTAAAAPVPVPALKKETAPAAPRVEGLVQEAREVLSEVRGIRDEVRGIRDELQSWAAPVVPDPSEGAVGSGDPDPVEGALADLFDEAAPDPGTVGGTDPAPKTRKKR